MGNRYSKPTISTGGDGRTRAQVRIYDGETGKLLTRKSTALTEKGKRAREREAAAWVESLREAERKAAEDAAGTDPAQHVRDTPLAAYVAAFIDEQEASKAIEESTVTGYRSTCKYIAELEGATVGNLTPETASAWEAGLTARGLSSSTVGKAHRLLKQVLQHWAIERDRAIPFNPMNQVRPPKRKAVKEGKNALEAADRRRLIDALDDTGNTPMTVAARISLYMGLRIGEICALQWRDVDLDAGLMTVSRAIGSGKGGEYLKATKTDRVRKPAIPAELVECLRRWRDEQADEWRAWGATLERESFVIGDPLGWAHKERIRREYNALAKLLNLKGTMGRRPTFHDLRHTWATMAIAGGMDPVTAAIYLGHSNPSMTLDIYAAPAPDQIARAAVLIGEKIRDEDA